MSETIFVLIIIIAVVSVFLLKSYLSTKKYKNDLHEYKVISLSETIYKLSHKNTKGILESLQEDDDVKDMENLYFNILFEFIIFYNHLVLRICEGNSKILNTQQLLEDISNRLIDITLIDYVKIFDCDDKASLIAHLKESMHKMNNFYKPFSNNLNDGETKGNLFWEFGKILSEDVVGEPDIKYIMLASEFTKLALKTMPFQLFLESPILPKDYNEVLGKK